MLTMESMLPGDPAPGYRERVRLPRPLFGLGAASSAGRAATPAPRPATVTPPKPTTATVTVPSRTGTTAPLPAATTPSRMPTNMTPAQPGSSTTSTPAPGSNSINPSVIRPNTIGPAPQPTSNPINPGVILPPEVKTIPATPITAPRPSEAVFTSTPGSSATVTRASDPVVSYNASVPSAPPLPVAPAEVLIALPSAPFSVQNAADTIPDGSILPVDMVQPDLVLVPEPAPEKSIFKNPYFWLAVGGVVVVGGTTIVLVKRRRASK